MRQNTFDSGGLTMDRPESKKSDGVVVVMQGAAPGESDEMVLTMRNTEAKESGEMVLTMRNTEAKESDEEALTAKHRIEAYWEGRSESFKAQRSAELASSQQAVWTRELTNGLPEGKKLHILDVGCGCGFFSLLLAQLGHRVTGIDLTEGMIEKGRELAEEYGADVCLLPLDAEQLSFPDESFDAIVTRNLTWTLPHPEKAYEEWLRVLKPGGVLLNFDAEHARYHESNGLAGETAHRMLSKEQIEESMCIYHMLPISDWERPAWDKAALRRLGCSEVEIDQKVSERLFAQESEFSLPYPMFLIRAVKGVNPERKGGVL